MMELTIAYDDTTRALGEPASNYGGTTLDVAATRITITGIPAGFSARLDFDVQVRVEGRAQRVKPYLALELDSTGTTGSCVVPGVIMAAATDLRLPVQLVLTDGTVTYASRNIVKLRVTPSINSRESVEDAYGPDISLAFIDVDEDGGVITFTRIDGTQVTVKVDDDFVAWSDVLTAWPAGTEEDPITDDQVPSAKLADATFVRIQQEGASRLLITDEDGDVTDDGPHIAIAWNDEPSDDYLPTERLVKMTLDEKAEDDEVVHNDVGTPAWSSTIEYGAGSTVVYNLDLYISQNDGNIGHVPDEESSVWWSLVQGSGGGGGSTEKGAFRTFVLGDGETTAYTCNHGLNTYLVSYFLYSTSGQMENRLTSFRRSSTNHVVVEFATPPAEDELTLVVYRPGLGPETVVTTINGLTGDVTIDPLALGCLSVDPQELTDDQKAQVLANIGLTGTVAYTSEEKAKLSDIEDGAQANVQADWDEDDATADSYILHKPSLGTASERDTGTASGNVPVLGTDGKLPSSVIPAYALSEYKGTVSTVDDLTTLSTAEVGDWAVVTADPDETACGSYMLTGAYSTASAWVQIVGPGKVVSVNGQTGVVILDADDVGAVPTGRTVNGHALSANIILDADDVGAVPTTTEVNGKPLSADIDLTATDVGAVPSVDGIVAGTYPKVTIDEYGLVLSGEDLAASDIPDLPASRITSGTMAVARLPTGVGANAIVLIPSAGTAGQVLRLNSAGTAFEWYTPSSSDVAVYTGTIEGDGSTTVFTLTHGLSRVPAITLIDPDGKVVTTSIVVDTSSIVVTFRTAPESGATYTVKAVA